MSGATYLEQISLLKAGLLIDTRILQHGITGLRTSWFLVSREGWLIGVEGASQTMGRGVKSVDPHRLIKSESSWLLYSFWSRTRVGGSKMIRYRCSPHCKKCRPQLEKNLQLTFPRGQWKCKSMGSRGSMGASLKLKIPWVSKVSFLSLLIIFLIK